MNFLGDQRKLLLHKLSASESFCRLLTILNASFNYDILEKFSRSYTDFFGMIL